MSEAILTRLPGSPGCFICDNNGSNPRALHLALMWDEAAETVRIDFQPEASWCGYAEVVHGGLVSAVMDEAMAWAFKQKFGDWGFTADFQVRFKKPVRPGRSYCALARVTEARGRKITLTARVLDADDGLCAQATGIFMPAGGLASPRSEA